MGNIATRCLSFGQKIILPFSEPICSVMNEARQHPRYLRNSLLSYFAVTPPYVVAHESLHMLGEYLSRGIVGTMNLGSMYGGGILHQKFPRYFGDDLLGSSPLEQLCLAGKYHAAADLQEVIAQTEMVKTPSSEVVVGILPYVLTPFGILLLRRSLAKKSTVGTGIGALLAFAPAMNFFGDLAIVGYRAAETVNNGVKTISPFVHDQGERFLRAIDTPSALGLVAVVAVGLAATNIVYRSSRSIADFIEKSAEKIKK